MSIKRFTPEEWRAICRALREEAVLALEYERWNYKIAPTSTQRKAKIKDFRHFYGKHYPHWTAAEIIMDTKEDAEHLRLDLARKREAYADN